MTDHYLRSLELLDEIKDLRLELAEEYARPATQVPSRANGMQGRMTTVAGPRSNELSRLHQSIGACMKLAAIHAQLATCQAVYDARAVREILG